MKAKINKKEGGIFIQPENEKEIKVLKKIWKKGDVTLFCKALFLNKDQKLQNRLKKKGIFGLWLGNNKIGLPIPGPLEMKNK